MEQLPTAAWFVATLPVQVAAGGVSQASQKADVASEAHTEPVLQVSAVPQGPTDGEQLPDAQTKLVVRTCATLPQPLPEHWNCWVEAAHEVPLATSLLRQVPPASHESAAEQTEVASLPQADPAGRSRSEGHDPAPSQRSVASQSNAAVRQIVEDGA